MNVDDVEVYLDSSSPNSYIESLIKSRQALISSHKYQEATKNILIKLDEVIQAELEVALLGAEKAKSEVLKAASKGSISPLKGA